MKKIKTHTIPANREVEWFSYVTIFSHRNRSHVTGGRNQSASELILLLSGVAGNSFFLFFLVRAAAATVSHCGSVSGNERTLSRSAHARFFLSFFSFTLTWLTTAMATATEVSLLFC
jgi:hypothetical protein